MITERKTGRCTRAGNLKFIDDLLPQFAAAHLNRSTPDIHSPVEFAQIKLFSADGGHLEIIVTESSLKDY